MGQHPDPEQQVLPAAVTSAHVVPRCEQFPLSQKTHPSCPGSVEVQQSAYEIPKDKKRKVKTNANNKTKRDIKLNLARKRASYNRSVME